MGKLTADRQAGHTALAEAPAAPARRRWPRHAGLAIAVLALAAMVAVGLLAHQGLQVRDELLAARSAVEQARAAALAGDVDAARDRLRDLRDRTSSARHATDGPLWAAAGVLAWVGDDARAVRTLSVQLDVLAATALPRLLEASAGLDPARLRIAGDTLDLDPMVAAAPALADTHADVRAVADALDRIETDELVRPVRDAVAQVRSSVDDLATVTGTASATARILPRLLGVDGERRHLVVFQNLAESRGTGGITGAFAVLEADEGRVGIARMAPNDALGGGRVRPDFGEDFQSLYGHPGLLFVNANLSPHFPYAGEVMLAGYEQATGDRLDGVIATDPVALGYLLEATGPITLPDGQVVDGANAARLTMSEVYERFPGTADNADRGAYLQRVGEAVFDTVLSGAEDPAAMAQALGRAIGESRLQVYSAEPDLQEQIEGTALAGRLPTGDGPFLGVSHVQMLANKMDYHLDRAVSYELGACDGSGTRSSRAAVTLTNTAPGSGLPPYVSGGPGPEEGLSRLKVSLHATRGATLDGISVDGEPSFVTVVEEQGRPVFVVTVDLLPGQQRLVTADMTEPAGAGQPRIWVQPGVREPASTITGGACGADGSVRSTGEDA